MGDAYEPPLQPTENAKPWFALCKDVLWAPPAELTPDVISNMPDDTHHAHQRKMHGAHRAPSKLQGLSHVKLQAVVGNQKEKFKRDLHNKMMNNNIPPCTAKKYARVYGHVGRTQLYTCRHTCIHTYI